MDVIEELKFLGKFTQIQKSGGGSVWGDRAGGLRVDVTEELKFFVKIKKKWGGGVRGGGRVGGGGGGQGGCERRIEVFVKIQKKRGGAGRGGGGRGEGSGLGGSGWM